MRFIRFLRFLIHFQRILPFFFHFLGLDPNETTVFFYWPRQVRQIEQCH
jgi:hypothetical protein